MSDDIAIINTAGGEVATIHHATGKNTYRIRLQLVVTHSGDIQTVDGTMTDGGMYYSESGDELKKFNTRDGMGFQLLHQAGIKTGIITSENTKILENRAQKLKIDYLRQSKRDGGKVAAAQEICDELGITLSNVAYIGDDINCYDLLSQVGYPACPADAQPKVKSICDIQLMTMNGGYGCVREFVDRILDDNI